MAYVQNISGGATVMLRTYSGGGVPLPAPVQVNTTRITANVNGGLVAAPSITALSDWTIVERALDAGVPIESNAAIAVALAQIEIDQTIPPDLFRAVAQVIGFLMRKGAMR